MLTCYPPPQIGFYQAECCILDLRKIETAEDLQEALERVADNDEFGPLMVFPTLAEAIAAVPTGGLSEVELAEQYERLGWVAPC